MYVMSRTNTSKIYVRPMSYTVKTLLADSPETSIYMPLFCPISQYMFKSVTPFGVEKRSKMGNVHIMT